MHAFYKPRLPDALGTILQLGAKMVYAASDVIIILLALLIVFIGLESAALRKPVITSSPVGRAACDGEDITLTCDVLGAGRLTWVIGPVNDTIVFSLSEDSESLSVPQHDSTGQFSASLTHFSRDQEYSFLGNLTSTLQTQVNSSTTHYPVTIYCNDGLTISVPFFIRLAGVSKPSVFCYARNNYKS